MEEFENDFQDLIDLDIMSDFPDNDYFTEEDI